MDGVFIIELKLLPKLPLLFCFYLIEIELPGIVNYGPAELYIEADGRESNRVRIFIEP